MYLTTKQHFVSCLCTADDGQIFGCYKELTLSSVYQPIFDANSDAVGVEALVRIKDRDDNMIRPDLYFSSPDISDQDKLNVERLSRVVHLRNFAQSNYRHLRLFLNVLPAAGEHLAIEDLSGGLLANRLKDLNLCHSQLVMEIVELTAQNEQILQTAISRLDQYGFNIAVDDYGVNASNRCRVESLKPHIVKMDRSLLLDYMKGAKQELLSGIALARSIGSKIVVEGIETQAQLSAMLDLKIDMFQGYFLAMPNPLAPSLATA